MTSPVRLTAGDAGASQALIDAYAESWQRINDAQLALSADPLNARKRARLNELQDMVAREVWNLDHAGRAYANKNYPKVYANAYERGAVAVDPAALAYVQPNRDAARLLADGLERQLLEATAHVDATTKELVRKIGRDAGLKTAIEGKTAKQAATEMRRILQESGIHAVTYSNGAKVGLKAYTEMAIRTSTALALNQGALQGGADAGCQFWEIFDGLSCGWTSHGDADKAHGKIVTREEALRFPIAHPNCRRAVGPRPDLGVDAPSSPRKPAGAPVSTAPAPSPAEPPPRARKAAERAVAAQQRTARPPVARKTPETRVAQAQQRVVRAQARAVPAPARPPVAAPTPVVAGGRTVPVTRATAAQAKKVTATFDHHAELGVRRASSVRSVSFGNNDYLLEGVSGPVPVGTVHARRLPNGEIRMHEKAMTQGHHDDLVSSNWFSKRETDSLSSVLTHEIGHHLDHGLNPQKRMTLFTQLANDLGVAPPKSFTDFGRWAETNRSKLTRNVSQYGASNDRELVAELWAEYATPGTVRPIAQRAGDLIRKMLSGDSPTVAPSVADRRVAPPKGADRMEVIRRNREIIRAAEEKARLRKAAGR